MGTPSTDAAPQARRQLAARLRARAHAMGFWACTAAEATALAAERAQLEQWLAQGHHGTMGYMAEQLEARTDPRLLLPGCRTVVVLAHDYLPPGVNAQGPLERPPGVPKIARYAHGQDYHWVLRGKLTQLANALAAEAAELGLPAPEARPCVDSAPVMERAWAQRAGLGWQGKNTLILHPGRGSYFFLAVLLLDVALADVWDEAPAPRSARPIVADHCGSCTRCLDACPTQALEPYRIDARRCLSYQTIERKAPVEAAYRGQTEGWAFGCDICQEVCPWNKFSVVTAAAEFAPAAHAERTAEAWAELSPSRYSRAVRPTALSRNRHAKWMDNLAAAGLLPDAPPPEEMPRPAPSASEESAVD